MDKRRVCTRCVMDTTAADIVFDRQGICNYCRGFDARLQHAHAQGAATQARREQFIAIVKANGAVASRIEQLQSERAPLAKELDDVKAHLKQMQYTESHAPDPYDDAKLAELRKSRNAAVYEEWKTKTANYLKRNRGKLPW